LRYSNLSDTTLRKGAAVAIFSAICYAGAPVFVRYAYQAGLLPGTAVFLRFALASLALILFLVASRRWVNLPPRQALILFSLGFFAYTTLGTTWFVALSLSPAWLVSLVSALCPLTVNLGSWLFLKERIDRSRLLALAAVVLGGIALFWRPFAGAAWAGVALMGLNILVQTAYVLVGQRYTRGVPPAMSAAWMIAGAAGGTFLYASLSGQLSFAFAPVGWLWASLFAVFSTALAIMALWWAIGLIGPGRTAILGSLEPLTSIVLAVIFLGERITPLQGVGGAFILVGMLLAQWQPAPPPERFEPRMNANAR
jgi:drug/metabolite transporter (DMT)-like permease